MLGHHKVLLSFSAILALAVLLGDTTTAEATDTLECSPCTTNTGGWITHDWELSCCQMDSPGCYMYPDAQQTGNGGSCPGMHRPCAST